MSEPEFPLDLNPKNPALLRNINWILGNQIYGQTRQRLLTFTVALSSKTKYPLAEVLLGDPGASKNTTVKVVLANFDNVIEVTSGSAKFLDYWPEDQSIEHTILYIPEIFGIREAGESIKILLSEGILKRATVVKDAKSNRMRTEFHKVPGKPVFISTSKVVKIREDIDNRIIVHSMDQTPDQIGNALKWLAQRAGRPHHEDPQPDRELSEFVKQFSPTREVMVPFLEPVAEKLPRNKTLIFRRYNQLESLVKVSALIHYLQRTHVRIQDSEYIVADPADFLYARDLLGPGGIGLRMDQRLKTLYETMELNRTYTTPELGKALNRSRDTILKQLDQLDNQGLIFTDKTMKTYTFTKLEASSEEDSLKPEYLQGYELNGLKLDEWIEEVSALVTYKPARVPEYMNSLAPSTGQLSRRSIWAQESPQIADSAIVSPIMRSSAIIGPRSVTDDTEGREPSGHLVADSHVSDSDFSVSDRKNEPSDKPQTMSGGPSDASDKLSDTENGLSVSGDANRRVSGEASGEEVRLVKQAFRDEEQRMGYGHMAKIRYLVREKIPDPNRVTRIVGVMAKNGELSPEGGDCFKLRSQSSQDRVGE